MAKKQSELLPTDEVMIEIGAKTDQINGKSVTVDKAKQMHVTKACFDGFDADEDGFSNTLGRTVTLLGTVKYSKDKDRLGNEILVPGLEAFKAETPAKTDEIPAA